MTKHKCLGHSKCQHCMHQPISKWLLEQFAYSAFKTDGQFPAMSGKPTHIHLKQEAVPKAKHRPIPVPCYLKEPVRKSLMQDRKGHIKTSTHWHSYGLVQHNGDYNKKEWSAKTYHRLSISEFAMQARNLPHCLTFPAGNTGATQCQEDSAGCCRWLSLCYIR